MIRKHMKINQKAFGIDNAEYCVYIFAQYNMIDYVADVIVVPVVKCKIEPFRFEGFPFSEKNLHHFYQILLLRCRVKLFFVKPEQIGMILNDILQHIKTQFALQCIFRSAP